MRMIPILYSTPMVQAIQLDKKTKTRRTKGLEKVNEKPNEWILDGVQLMDSFIFHNIINRDEFWVKCPYGNVGDILWVRETFRPIEQENGSPRFEYKATETINIKDKWKPSLFMPKAAARIFLMIKSVTVERLQDISETDAIAEGVLNYKGTGNYVDYFSDPKNESRFIFAKDSFKSLWQKINGVDSWGFNPWVWVIEFEIIEKPKNII